MPIQKKSHNCTTSFKKKKKKKTKGKKPGLGDVEKRDKAVNTSEILYILRTLVVLTVKMSQL